jgi:small subunit ribosomal protein S20
MANIKSQKKRIKTNERRRVANRSVRSALKTYLKRFEDAVEAGDAETARTAMQRAGRELDKAAAAGTIHSNNAAHKKSMMARRLASLS